MENIIIFFSYFCISMLLTWVLVLSIKKYQWDIKSAQVLLIVILTVVGVLLLAIMVSKLEGDMTEKTRNLTTIFGVLVVIINIVISLIVMHFIRKMLYMQATFRITHKNKDATLAEDTMTCLITRKEVLNVQKYLKPKIW